ncbi:hypothetical protein L2K70_02480 [Nocardioides KLBMP 9356]|uniref:Uncharacterized protein n=1 Tax=Nocardioides potassii TaxID=2911371 RepID=A0ABS9H882_9ACTN|nr:hypothetical protein [Nocardioides potassii]MCF6376459.1 hypothetical protein [Nocardioides potassii]
MAETLQFLVEHLLRAGARAEGRPRFDGFSFDHVLSGAVIGRRPGARTTYAVTVSDNVVTGRTVPSYCPGTSRPRAMTGGRPANVIELRPRRA